MADKENPTLITILERAFHIMDVLLESEETLGLSEITKLTGIPKANTFRILKTLESLDAIGATNEKYSLGHKMIQYGNGAKRNSQTLTLILPYLKELSVKTEETINFGVPYKNDLLMLHTEIGSQTTLVSNLPPISPMYCSSIGKLFLADMPEQQLEQYFQSVALEKRTIRTLQSKEEFLKMRPLILEKNIAYDYEEYEYGLSCIARAVRNKEGELIGGISVSGPTSRLEYKGFENLEELLNETTLKMEETLCKWEASPIVF